MNLARYFLPPKTRDAFEDRFRDSSEQAVRVDYLRSLRPVSFLIGSSLMTLCVVRFALGLTRWIDYISSVFIIVLAASQLYMFVRAGVILKNEERK